MKNQENMVAHKVKSKKGNVRGKMNFFFLIQGCDCLLFNWSRKG